MFTIGLLLSYLAVFVVGFVAGIVYVLASEKDMNIEPDEKDWWLP